MENDIRIETDRLRLRSWRKSDFKQYEESCNTPDVMRRLGGVQTSSQVRADVRYFIASEARRGITYWVVERRADNVFLGFCGLVRIPDRDCPIVGELEIGWRIAQRYWRHGYGFEAARAVLAYAFGQFDADHVFSRTTSKNGASRALMNKVGLKRRPDLDYVPLGEREKLLVYAISLGQWRS